MCSSRRHSLCNYDKCAVTLPADHREAARHITANRCELIDSKTRIDILQKTHLGDLGAPCLFLSRGLLHNIPTQAPRIRSLSLPAGRQGLCGAGYRWIVEWRRSASKDSTKIRGAESK